MHRFFSPSQNISDDEIIITDKNDTHHIRDVLRLKEKDKVIVFDERGCEYDCLIEKLSGKIVLNILDKRLPQRRKITKITVACAIPKKSRMDDIVDKLTQLGVDTIIPLLTERVVVKLDKDKEVLRLKRWQKIALSAARQCQTNAIPVIEPVKNIKDVLSKAKGFDLKLLPTLSGRRKSLKEAINNLNRDSDHFLKNKKMVAVPNILVLIGPEGDFSDEEVALAKKAGFIPVSLGDFVLRVETAAVTAASFIRFYFDENF